jgi:Spy/CpxP family protein refolding chaperone
MTRFSRNVLASAAVTGLLGLGAFGAKVTWAKEAPAAGWQGAPQDQTGANPLGGRPGRHMGARPARPLAFIRRGLRALDLTDTQRAQIKSTMASHKADIQGLVQRGAAARKALNDATWQSPVNKDAVRDAAAGVAAVQADGAVLRAQVQQEVFALLTPEQQQKAAQMRADVRQRLQDRQQRMKKPGGPDLF